MIALTQTLLRPVPHVLGDGFGSAIARLFSRSLKRQICGVATDAFLELLLSGMSLAFVLSTSYRRNIKGFKATYVFCTADGLVAASAAFTDGKMRMLRDAAPEWQTKVTFKDAPAFQRFLFGKDQDIFNSLLANEVEVSGNLSLVYKFGFLARDLARRFGV